MPFQRIFISVWLIVCWLCTNVSATVTTFTDKQQWQSAVGAYTTIDFTGFPNNTFITDQYEHLGVLFTDGADFIHVNSTAYPNDGAGLRGGIPHTITIEFASPIQWIAMDFPGGFWVELYTRGQIFYTSNELGGSGSGNFAGLVSTLPFDKVRVFDQIGGGASIDDLYFGPPIPSPGAIVALCVSVLLGFRRRRLCRLC